MNDFAEKPENFKNLESSTLLDYYKDHNLNPVPIPIDTESEWNEHVKRRRNLYERHLKIPVSFFSKKDVLEFGCNSGENSLYLSYLGAKLTLVEPNEKVHPRLIELFRKHNKIKSISKLIPLGIDEFRSTGKYDVVIAEGFLNALKNRNETLRNISRLVKEGGFGIITEDDRYGCFIECLKQVTLKRICELSQVDYHSKESFRIAIQLFGEEYNKLNTTRPIRTWWKDAIVSPFNTGEFLWSFLDVITILEEEGCEFWASSPAWSTVDSFQWYKNHVTTGDRHKALKRNFRDNLPYILTGICMDLSQFTPVTNEILNNLSDFINAAAKYTTSEATSFSLALPDELTQLLRSANNNSFNLLSDDLEGLFNVLSLSYPKRISEYFSNTKKLKYLWGNTMFYIVFCKRSALEAA